MTKLHIAGQSQLLEIKFKKYTIMLLLFKIVAASADAQQTHLLPFQGSRIIY
jgi:hypothetical protein